MKKAEYRMQNQMRGAGTRLVLFLHSSFYILHSAFRMNPLPHILILLVRVYRVTLSPAKIFLFGSAAQCRFEPSCSQYAIEALKTHGAFTGSWLAAKRVCRCHPWGECGEDSSAAEEVPNSIFLR